MWELNALSELHDTEHNSHARLLLPTELGALCSPDDANDDLEEDGLSDVAADATATAHDTAACPVGLLDFFTIAGLIFVTFCCCCCCSCCC